MHKSHGFSKQLFIESVVHLRRLAIRDPAAAFGSDLEVFHNLVRLAVRVSLTSDEKYGDVARKSLEDFAEAMVPFVARAAETVVSASPWLAPNGGAADLRRPDTWYPVARGMKRKVTYHAGPTNSGKTYNALKALKESWSGVYCGPLRLLALEVYESLNLDGTPCSLLTGQERRLTPFATHIASTVEMLNMEDRVDCAVIDEIQLIGDEFRGASWTRAVLGVPAEHLHLCGDPSAVPVVSALCAITGDSFEVKSYNRLTSISPQDTSLGGEYSGVEAGDAIIAFSRKDIYAVRKAVERNTAHKCCVVYGSLPPETRSAQARLFNDPNSEYRVLVASDAVGMGLNLNIRRVVFHTMEKFDGIVKGPLKPSSIKQIAGRAGRRNSIYPEGFATTLQERDLPALHSALAAPPVPLHAAGLFPNGEQLLAFSAQLPLGTPLSQVIAHFITASRLEGPYFMCRGEEMIATAELLERYKHSTTMEQRAKLCLLPANLRNNEVRRYLFNFLDLFVVGSPVKLNLHLPVNDPVYLMQELGSLEAKAQALDIYAWLAQKLGESAFVDAREAAEKRLLCTVYLETALTTISETAKVRGGRGARAGRRQEGAAPPPHLRSGRESSYSTRSPFASRAGARERDAPQVASQARREGPSHFAIKKLINTS